MTVRVRVEMMNVSCNPREFTEDITGADELYLVGGMSTGLVKTAMLTTPISINNNEVKGFPPQEALLFEADVPDNTLIAGAILAYDEDSAKDWSKRPEWVDGFVKKISEAGISSANPYFIAGVLALNLAIFLTNADQDDQLGQLQLSIPAAGPEYEERDWNFFKRRRHFFDRYSDWNYTLRYRVTRANI